MGSFEEGSISLGPWGGPDGDHWSFEASRGINGIIIHQGVNIKSISFKDANGHHSGTFGGRNHNDLGEEKMIDIQWPSEYLTSITGSYGDFQGELVVTSLSFKTNLTTYGPFGTDSGTSFSIPMQGCVVFGFYGRSGQYLNALGIYVKPEHTEGRISFGPWGGSNGHGWSFMASSGINEIILHDDRNNIKSISFGDANGQHSITFGGENCGDVGEEKKIKIDWPSEYLTSITGSCGYYYDMFLICSLSFVTNYTTYGPFGTTSLDSPFSIPIGGGAIVGFYGRCGHYLDNLGIFVKPKFLEGTLSMGQWGGEGGDPWNFIASRGIKEIIIYQGDNINSIAFSDTNGLYSGTFGGKNLTDPGTKQTINIDWPSEYLMFITGSYGTHDGILGITSLSFTTNRATYGPFGKVYGTSFSIPIDGGVLVGFHGRAGNYLDAIGFYVRPVVT